VDATGRQRYGVQVQTKFLNPEEQDMVIAALETAFGTAGEETALEVYGVDSLISQEMLSKSLLALLIAGALILGYMAFRFEFKSGVTGLFALVFDVMSVIGLFALLQKQVNVTFIAALLTIIGYSINNSIVVFDRIRENLRFRKKDESLVEVVNFSILQTMRRSVNTSATTVITIFLLYLIGSASIRDFCLAMIAGFTVGTFTSLFVAGPLWAIWKDSEERKKGRPAPAGAR
jgi:preprotein translocase subunit SecF